MWNLAIDFGTSNTTGATWADGRVEALEVRRDRRVPSVVLLSDDGSWVVGREADNQAVVVPERVERAPKRRLGKGHSLLLGGQAVPITSAVAALMGPHVVAARERHPGSPEHVVLTHPARWGPERFEVLRAAAAEAGFARVELLPEPVAAAHHVDDEIEVGQHVAVYDLGGGTFDTAVMRRTETSFKVVGLPGGTERIGGEDFDHRMYQHLGEAVAREDAAVWEAMTTSDERRWRRAAADLLTQARDAKEQLSRNPRASVYVGALERDISVTREEFDALVSADVDRTVDEMSRTIQGAGLADDDVVKVYLVGGSSRLTLVQERMGARFGSRVSTWDDPKGVVVLGAAKFSGTLAGTAPTPAPASTPPPTPTGPVVVSAPPPRTGGFPEVAAPPPPAAPAAGYGTVAPPPGAPAAPRYGAGDAPPPGTPAPAAPGYAPPGTSGPPPGAPAAPGAPYGTPPVGGPAPSAAPYPVGPASAASWPAAPTGGGWGGTAAPGGYGTAPAGPAPGNDKVLIAWVCAGLALLCCVPAPAVGLYFANEAKKAGHPQGQTALIVNAVALGISVLGFFFLVLASLGSSSTA